ncbi:unnamed protein product [Linum trigynum]|uniref:Uncharacterized protein n=1 Tax=Linum trigynum TaxID=586398 RepID=A0AAV2DTD8_9ROSI
MFSRAGKVRVFNRLRDARLLLRVGKSRRLSASGEHRRFDPPKQPLLALYPIRLLRPSTHISPARHPHKLGPPLRNEFVMSPLRSSDEAKLKERK